MPAFSVAKMLDDDAETLTAYLSSSHLPGRPATRQVHEQVNEASWSQGAPRRGLPCRHQPWPWPPDFVCLKVAAQFKVLVLAEEKDFATKCRDK